MASRLLCLLPAALVVAATAGPSRVLEQSVDYPGSEGEMPARIYRPESGGRRPGVLILHTMAGPGPNVEAFARRLAGQGYVTMTPDLFSLHEFGAEGRADHPLILGDLDGALDFLRRHPAVEPSRIAVVGFSFGGRLALIAAAGHADIKAVVVHYAVASYQELAKERPVAGRALQTRPATDFASKIRAPVLIHHGLADRSTPASQGVLLHRALTAAGKQATLHLYPDADHLFNFEISAEGPGTYREEAARVSWERTIEFLERNLSY